MLKSLRPNNIIQANTLFVGRITISSTPLTSIRRCKLWSRQSLQCFHTCIIIVIICSKSANTCFFKFLARQNKAVIICRQLNTILFKQSFVYYKSMRIRAYRKPVHTSILVHEIIEICIIDCTCLICCGKIHKTILKRTCIMKWETTTRNNIRKSAIFIQELIKIQIVIANYKFNIHIWKLWLNIRCIFIIQICGPQVHPDCFCLLFFYTLFHTAC